MSQFTKGNNAANGKKVGKTNTKRRVMTEALMISLNEAVEDAANKGQKTKRLRMIADRLVQKAADGDIQAIKEVFDRTEGKAAQALILQGDEDKPVIFNTYYEPKPE